MIGEPELDRLSPFRRLGKKRFTLYRSGERRRQREGKHRGKLLCAPFRRQQVVPLSMRLAEYKKRHTFIDKQWSRDMGKVKHRRRLLAANGICYYVF